MRSRGLDRPSTSCSSPRPTAACPPARAVAGRRVLRLRGRPVLGRRRARVPVRHRATKTTASGGTGRCGRRRAPRRSARSSSGWTGSPSGSSAHPDLHVFHFNAYEPTALKRARRAPRGRRARARRAAAPQGARRPLRHQPTGDAGRRRELRPEGARAGHRVRARRGAARRDSARCGAGRPGRTTASSEHLDGIAGYNEDDCAAHARAVRAGCSTRRPEAEAQYGIELDALQPEPAQAAEPKLAAYLARLEAMRPRLLAGLPDDESEDTASSAPCRTDVRPARLPPPRSQAGVVGVLRPARAQRWTQLRDEDSEAIGGPRGDRRRRSVQPQSCGWTLSFPSRSTSSARATSTSRWPSAAASCVELDEARRTVVGDAHAHEGRRSSARARPRLALPRPTPRSTRCSVRRARRPTVGWSRAADSTPAPSCCAAAPGCARGTPPLVRRAGRPRPLVRAGARPRQQCPHASRARPGTGKTWTGARLAVDLLERRPARRRLPRPSHKAINNLLAAIDEAADEAGVAFRGWKKAADPEDDNYDSDRIIVQEGSQPDGRTTGRSCCIGGDGVALGGATASATASTCCSSTRPGRCRSPTPSRSRRRADSVVLLGDPQQLAHVSQGTHPLGSRRLRARAPARRPRHHAAGPRRLPRHVVAHAPGRLRLRLAHDVRRRAWRSVAGARAPAHRLAGAVAAAGCACIGVDHLDNRGRSTEEADGDRRSRSSACSTGTWTRPRRRRPPS